MKEKRMINTYEVKNNIFIGNLDVVFAVDESKEYPFLVCYCTYDNPLGIDFPGDEIAFDNYLEAMEEFTERVSKQIKQTREELSQFHFDSKPLSLCHCIPDKKDTNIIGKVVALDISQNRYEYRHIAYQIILVDGGNGAYGWAGRRAVHGVCLSDGSSGKWERYQVLGEIKPEFMPEWVKERLDKLQKENN